MDEVFEARIAVGRRSLSSDASSSRFGPADSIMASTKKSAVTSWPIVAAGLRRARAASRSSSEISPFSTNFARLVSIVRRARSKAAVDAS
jgi:hypothetical protein